MNEFDSIYKVVSLLLCDIEFDAARRFIDKFIDNWQYLSDYPIKETHSFYRRVLGVEEKKKSEYAGLLYAALYAFEIESCYHINLFNSSKVETIHFNQVPIGELCPQALITFFAAIKTQSTQVNLSKTFLDLSDSKVCNALFSFIDNSQCQQLNLSSDAVTYPLIDSEVKMLNFVNGLVTTKHLQQIDLSNSLACYQGETGWLEFIYHLNQYPIPTVVLNDCDIQGLSTPMVNLLIELFKYRDITFKVTCYDESKIVPQLKPYIKIVTPPHQTITWSMWPPIDEEEEHALLVTTTPPSSASTSRAEFN